MMSTIMNREITTDLLYVTDSDNTLNNIAFYMILPYVHLQVTEIQIKPRKT